MRHHTIRRAAVAAVAVAATVTGIAINGAATAEEPTGASGTATSVQAAKAAAKNVERQRGVVLEGTATLRGKPVLITVYDNSIHGSSVQVVLGDPDDNRFGYAERSKPFVVNGMLRATVKIDGKRFVLRGAVVETDEVTKIKERVEDAGELIISRGTNTQLLTDVHAKYAGKVTVVKFAPAFAFDLKVRRISIVE